MAGEQFQKFSFQLLASKTFPSLQLKDFKESLQKWGMGNRLLAQTYSFDQQFKPYNIQQFALEFFQNDQVVQSIQHTSSSGSTCYGLGTKASCVEVESCACTAVSMSLFDKLQDEGIVQENGYIKKCLEEYIDSVPIPDELRNVLLNEEFEKYDTYSDDERNEFLLRLFTHLCVGGGVCQYEDYVTDYINHTKHLYKDLVSVQKEPGSSDLHVISQVYKVKAKDGEDDIYFPDDKDHINSFSYLIVDPYKRHLTLLHHKYAGGIW